MLSPRERDVLQGLADGLTYQQIGTRLYLSMWTAKAAADKLRRKLGAVNSTHAVALAFHAGLLAVETPTDRSDGDGVL